MHDMMFNNARTVIWNGEITGKDFGYVQRSWSDPMHCWGWKEPCVVDTSSSTSAL